MILEILDSKAESLRKKSKPVKKIDKKIKTLISDMKKTLRAQTDPEGVGLAAPQIGKNLKIFVMLNEGVETVVINPKIVSLGRKKSIPTHNNNEILEGCLSIKHYYGPVERANHITIEYKDEKGNKHTKKFQGFEAQIIQHEIDHLNGKLFVDHILEQESRLFKIQGDEWEEVELI